MASKIKETQTPQVVDAAEKVDLKTVYTFLFGRNIYSIRMSDIKKITLLGHQFIDKKDDREEVTKTLYIFSVVGNQITGFSDTDAEGTARPMYETIMEVKAEEDDYSSLFNIYEDIVIKWDRFLQLPKG